MRLTLADARFTPPEPLLLLAGVFFAYVVLMSSAALWLYLHKRRAGPPASPLARFLIETALLVGVVLSAVYLLGSAGLLMLYRSYALDPTYQPSSFLATRSDDLYYRIAFWQGGTLGAGIVAGLVIVGTFVLGLVAARPAQRARVG